MIELNDVRKRFGAVVALDGVSLVAPDGVITGVLGPNGAGKTTALRIATGLFAPDSGDVRVDGADLWRDPLAARRSLGVLPHAHGLYPRLTPREHLRYFGRLYGVGDDVLARRIDELVHLLDMNGFADRPTEGFSQGQRLKTAIARALVHEPKNLVLDEPTSGMDIAGVRAMREVLRVLKSRGHAIIFSSHVMQEATALCDQLVVIGQGRVRATGTIDDIRRAGGSDNLEDAVLRLVGAEGIG